MVKKYPFSTKAAKAIIAATIAFTPVATTAGFFGADKAEAASWHFDTKASLANYANLIYSSSTNQADITKVQDSFQAIGDSEWRTILEPILEPAVVGNPAKEQELANAIDLLQLQFGLTLGQIQESDITTVIMTTKDNFGFGDTPQAQVDEAYLNYLENVEAQLRNLTSNPTNLSFDTILMAMKNASGDQRIKNKIAETFVLTEEKAQQVKTNLQTSLTTGQDAVTTTEIQRALAGAYTGWNTAYNQGGSNNGGGGDPGTGGGSVTPGDPVVVNPVTADGATEVTVTIPVDLQGKIISAVEVDAEELVIQVPNREDGKPVVLDLPASLAIALKAKAPAADLVIDAGDVKYVIPLSQIDISALATGLGGNLSGISLRINIDELTNTEADNLEDLIEDKAGTSAASSETKAAAIVNTVEVKAPAVKVKVELAQNGTVVRELKSFGDVYVNQELTIDGSVNTNNATGVVVAADGSLRALPTTFETVDEVDDEQVAVVRTLANTDGVYTVIESAVTFPDVDNGKNWAEEYIESLASKFIIAGTTAGTYKPDQDMTRSQFAVLLSRALGLPGTTAYDGRFKDVKGNEWFNTNGEFMAAVKYGIIAGKPNGTFAPNDKVTRAEAAAMIGRALELDFIDFDESQLDKKKKLSDFKDAKEIGASTRAEVLKVYQAGIMSGASNKEFNPNDYTKRDQMARILAEFLIKANLMDEIK
ncbi:S-layer homology domain-containing protein [Domibacillus indicus]|uniref:S-layer homology domain-containing protein n=1 Tax=Domibacillus indicus TaxID=1437523 RepID=UPI00203AAE0D|nr:S-layer homology domain-containing protein [Domibacillus indicus]MCM3788879.1 S-layer homology domain-containing protein [Domibacillus indicus]